jgi:ketol-acid reductoisomerase
VAPNLRDGGALVFAHGLSIRFALIEPRPDLDVLLVAPKGPGTALRSNMSKAAA